MEKGTYKQPVFEDGPYAGIALADAQGEYFLADVFLKRARQKDRPARTGDKIREENAERLEGEGSQSVYEELMNQIKNKQSYRPEVNISEADKPRLHAALDRFLKNTYTRDPIYAREVDAPYLLTWLVKNMTNSDCEDPVSHVNRYADFVADKTFEKMRTPMVLGKIDDAVFYALNTEEYEAGLETSDLFLFFAENGDATSRLPFLRYGIEQTETEPTAYIYAIQRRTVEDTPFNQDLKRIFAKANSGVKEYRDVQPSMLCVLSAFTGMLNAKGIERLKVPDCVVRRWGEFWNSDTEESDVAIQTNATNKFLYTFQRLTNQFNGVDVIAYPNDVDSFMHIRISENAESTNPMLQKFFKMGKEATLERESEIVEPNISDLVTKWHLEATVPGESATPSTPGNSSTELNDSVVIDGMETLNIVINDKLTSSTDSQTLTE